MNQAFINALIGGALIGLSVTAMLLFNGRVTGISGIVSELSTSSGRRDLWRAAFVLGLLAGGLVLRLFVPESFENTTERGFVMIIVAGLLVGFGTVLGGGCTSGHGICGVSRLSPRSIVATLVFIALGFATIAVLRLVTGGA